MLALSLSHSADVTAAQKGSAENVVMFESRQELIVIFSRPVH